MRFAAMLSGLVLLCGLANAQQKGKDKKEPDKNLEPFQGTWKVVRAEFEGKEPKDKAPGEVRFTFKGDRLIVREGLKGDDDGKFAVNTKRKPTEIDLISSKGERIPGIYKFEDDGKLTLSFAKGKVAVRPKTFDTKKTMAGLLVLEKLKE
ncbi:MAG TPA: TIGR03067 domain-containing protein [Gemmata sp.]|nr:TIGR03067 domain-containing protein [Gemmata sp.]